MFKRTAFLVFFTFNGVLGHVNDYKCFKEAFGDIDIPGNSSEYIYVRINHWEHNRIGLFAEEKVLKSTRMEKLWKDQLQSPIYDYPFSDDSPVIQDFNPRALPLFYDGQEIKSAIADLLDSNINGTMSQEWKRCQAGTARPGGKFQLQFYRNTFFSESSKPAFNSTWQELDVQAYFPDDPVLKNYDDICAYDNGAHDILQDNKFFKVNVKHQVKTRDDKLMILEEKEVKITQGQIAFMQFNQTAATEEFEGFKANPRNLTLWLDNYGNLQASMAKLNLKKEVLESSTHLIEGWNCQKSSFYDDDLERTLTFCNNVFEDSKSKSDQLKITIIEEGVNSGPSLNAFDPFTFLIMVLISNKLIH